jgi:hypothetical protein
LLQTFSTGRSVALLLNNTTPHRYEQVLLDQHILEEKCPLHNTVVQGSLLILESSILEMYLHVYLLRWQAYCLQIMNKYVLVNHFLS